MVVDSAFGGDRGVGGGGRVATQTVVKVRTSVHHCEEDEVATEPLLAGTLLNIIQRWPWRDQDMVLRGDVRESVGNFLEGVRDGECDGINKNSFNYYYWIGHWNG